MPQRIVRLALAGIAAALLTVIPAPPATAATGRVNPPALWYKIAGEVSEADAIAAADRYRVVILQSWQTTAARIIKDRNPAVTVLAYKDLSSASFAAAALDNERNGRPMATGVGYLDAVANGWLALDTTGSPVVWEGYPNLWQMEVWNPAYQKRWVDNVTRELAGSVFDGVFGDDALTTLKFYSDATLAEAPTDADLQAGEEALIAKATAGLHAIGKKLVVNIAAATDYLPVWTRWSTMTDGAMLEHFAHWGSDPNSPSNYLWDWGSRGWTAGVAALATSPGNIAVTTSADTDDRSYRYGLASFLVATGGHGAFTAVDSYKKAPFRPEQAWDLGHATTPMVKVGAAYARTFPNGFAAVNPSKDTTVTVSLPAPLTDVTGATVTTVTLPPLTGAVFKGATATTVTAPTSSTTSSSPTLRNRLPRPVKSGNRKYHAPGVAKKDAARKTAPGLAKKAAKNAAPSVARKAAPAAARPTTSVTRRTAAPRLVASRTAAVIPAARLLVAPATGGHRTASTVTPPAGYDVRSAAAPAWSRNATDAVLLLLFALASFAWFSRSRRAAGSTSRSS